MIPQQYYFHHIYAVNSFFNSQLLHHLLSLSVIYNPYYLNHCCILIFLVFHTIFYPNIHHHHHHHLLFAFFYFGYCSAKTSITIFHYIRYHSSRIPYIIGVNHHRIKALPFDMHSRNRIIMSWEILLIFPQKTYLRRDLKTRGLIHLRIFFQYHE